MCILTLSMAGEGQTVFCETCPQYFVLDDSRYTEPNAEHFILQPPLRPQRRSD